MVNEMRAVLYLRQSLDLNGDGLAVARQENECRELAERRGWPVTDLYRDNDVSASGRRARPAFNRMLADATNGEFDVIVAYHLDRLTRTLKDYQPLLELAEKHGITIATVSGDLDLSTDMGQTVAGLLTVVANGEIKRKAARQSSSYRQRAQDGRPWVGHRPFGYGGDGSLIVEPEAELIRAAYQQVLAGDSVSSIARAWNAAGFTTRRGNPWTHHSVSRVLMNPRYAGKAVHQGQILDGVIGKWPALVNPDTYEAVNAVLTDPGRRSNPNRGGERRRLLTSIALCAVCGDGTTVVSGGNSARVAIYRCRTSKHLTRRADVIDEYITDVLLERFARDDARSLLTDDDAPDAAAVSAEIRLLNQRLNALVEDFQDGIITQAQMRAGTERARARIAEADAKLRHRRRGPLLGPLVNAKDEDERLAVWESMTMERRRAVVDELLTVTILRGKPGGNARGVTRKPLDVSTVKTDWQ